MNRRRKNDDESRAELDHEATAEIPAGVKRADEGDQREDDEEGEREDDDERQDDGGESDEQPQPPPPAATGSTNGAAKAAKKPARARGRRVAPKRSAPRVGRRRRADPEPLDSNDDDEAEAELEEDGPSPLEGASRSPSMEVSRVLAHGPANGYPEGDDSDGLLPGGVANRFGYKTEINARAGGGQYEVTGVINGKEKTRRITIPGPSKPIKQEEEVYSYEQPYTRPAYGPGTPGYPPGYSPFGPSYAPGATYGPGYSAPPAGYGPSYGSPAPPFAGSPMGQSAHAYHGMRGGVDEEARMREERLREELELTKEKERESREAAKIAEVKREADQREAAHKAEMDRVIAEVKSIAGRQPDDSWRERVEQERLDRERKFEEERAERERARAEEDKRRTEEKDRWEREYRERREREDREWKERKEKEDRDEKTRAEEGRRAEKNFDRMLTMMSASQIKPTEIITMLTTAKQQGGDFTEQMVKMATGFEAMKDAFGGGDRDEEAGVTGAAERVVGAVGEALTPALGEIAKIVEARSRAAPQQQQQGAPQVVYAPVNGYPGYFQPIHVASGYPAGPPVHQNALMIPQGQQQQMQALPGPVSPEQAQVNAGAARVENTHGAEVSPRQWGKILEHVVDAGVGQARPDETAQHLLTTLKALDAMPALKQLAEAKLPALRGKVNLLLMSKRVEDPHYVGKMQTFIRMSQDQNGARWLEGVLAELAGLHGEIMKIAQARMAQQQQANQANQAAQRARRPQVVRPPQPPAPQQVQQQPASSTPQTVPEPVEQGGPIHVQGELVDEVDEGGEDDGEGGEDGEEYEGEDEGVPPQS